MGGINVPQNFINRKFSFYILMPSVKPQNEFAEYGTFHEAISNTRYTRRKDATTENVPKV